MVSHSRVFRYAGGLHRRGCARLGASVSQRVDSITQRCLVYAANGIRSFRRAATHRGMEREGGVNYIRIPPPIHECSRALCAHAVCVLSVRPCSVVVVRPCSAVQCFQLVTGKREYGLAHLNTLRPPGALMQSVCVWCSGEVPPWPTRRPHAVRLRVVFRVGRGGLT